MKIKQIIFGAVAALGFTVASSSQTATAFTFGPASSCPTYCSGFTTDNSAYTIDFINPRYNNTTVVSVTVSCIAVRKRGWQSA
jgi:hypothetical protein